MPKSGTTPLGNESRDCPEAAFAGILEESIHHPVERPSLQDLFEPIQEDIHEVRRVFCDSLLSAGSSGVLPELTLQRSFSTLQNSVFSHQLIADIAGYLRSLEGKWLRPALVIFSTDLFGADRKAAARIGAALELIHNATLIHDDIIDESDTRRGKPAVWKRWGSSATVLMGDLLFAKAFELTTTHGNILLQRVIAQATSRMCQGELHQLQSAGNFQVTEEEYLQVVTNKTACLMSACTECGGLIAEAPEEALEALRRYGLYLGMAFQITDDVLDYVADPAELGKSVGNDVARGKVTLPLIHHLASITHPEPLIQWLSGSNGKSGINLAEALESTGSIQYALDRAEQFGEMAIGCLPVLSQWSAGTDKIVPFERLVEFVVSRRF